MAPDAEDAILTPARLDVLRAAVDTMVPADELPSGWESGVGGFIARILDTDLAPERPRFAAGLDALGAESDDAGTPFAELDVAGRTAILRRLEDGTAESADLVHLLADLCAQGYYGDPGNGGNRDAASWHALGYRLLPIGRTWPAPERAVAPTIDLGGVRDDYDAIVVGAGAGGGIAAQVLAEAGHRVLLVDRGSDFSSTELPLDQLRSERSATPYPTRTGPSPTGDPRVVVVDGAAETVFAPDERWGANAFAVGGGTRVYGAQAWRFAPTDFRMRTAYGRPEGSSLADWPLDYDELEEWYDRCEWEYGVSGDPAGVRDAGDRRRGYPMPAMPASRTSKVLARGAERLGLGTSSVPLLINSVPYLGRPACVQCGACVGYACHAGAKNGSFNTAIPRALATGRCDLLPDVQVERLRVDERGVVVGVDLARASEGGIERRSVSARTVVVAAGAIESARLLLTSTSPKEPDGIGNAHDQVGRNLQAHVYAGAIGLFDEVVQDSTGPGPNIATNDWRHGNPGIVGGGMIADDFVPTPLNAWATLAELGEVERWGAASKARMRELWPRMALVFGPVQEVPNPDSRVELDPEVRDRLGNPVARLSGDIHPEDRRGAALLADRASEWLSASGATRVIRQDAEDRPAGPSAGQHQAGTCRMGDEPAHSVTDRWGRVWGHPELLVADGSVHVTNGGVNPVLTIMALAYRNTARLVDDLAG